MLGLICVSAFDCLRFAELLAIRTVEGLGFRKLGRALHDADAVKETKQVDVN